MTVFIITYGILTHKYGHRHTDTRGRNERASDPDNPPQNAKRPAPEGGPVRRWRADYASRVSCFWTLSMGRSLWGGGGGGGVRWVIQIPSGR